MRAIDFLSDSQPSDKVSAKSFLSDQPEGVIEKPKKEFVQPYPSGQNANLDALGKTIVGLPRNIMETGEAIASGATLGLSDRAGQLGDYAAEKLTGVKKEQLPVSDHEPINKYVEGAAEFAGAVAPISVASKFLATPIKAAVTGLGKSKYIPPLANLIGWGVAGSAYDTTANLIKEGEMPTAKEIGASGAVWAGFEGALSSVGWTGRLALGVNRFAKSAGITRKEALNVILGEAKKTNAPISKFASDWSKYQVALKKMEGTERGVKLQTEINEAAEDFVANVDMLANKVGKQGTYPDLIDKIIQKDKDIIASKKGTPLLKPDTTPTKSRIPEPLNTGVPEGAEDVRPLWEIKQEAVNLEREKYIDAIIAKHEVMQRLADKGSAEAKKYVEENKEVFNTAWREKELLGKVKVQEGEAPLNIEQPLRPDQKAKLSERLRAEEPVPSNELSATEGAERRKIPVEEVKKDTQRRSEISKFLNSNLPKDKPLAPKSSLETLPSDASSEISKTSGQVPANATESIAGKATSPDAPTTDIFIQEGGSKGERGLSEILNDVKVVLGDLERGSVSNKPLTENQIAALERISNDAKKAGMDIAGYMKKAGASPEAIAKILANKQSLGEIQKQTPKQVYAPKSGQEIINEFAKDKNTIAKDTVRILDQALGTVSTRLGNIAPELKDRLRKHAYEGSINTKSDIDKVKPFYEKVNKLPEQDQFQITLLLRNAQYDKEARKQAILFMKEKGVLAEYSKANDVIKDLLERGKKSGIDIKDIEGYFPSHVKDYVGLRESLGKDAMGKIDEAIAKEASKRNITVDELGDESKSAIIDSMIKGWPKNKIFLFDPFEIKSGIGRSRTLRELDSKLLQHYYPAHESMVKYVSNMNAAIANNNFFKKSRKVSKAIRNEGLDADLPMGRGEASESIGDIIKDLKKNKSLSMEQEAEIRDVLMAYFMPKSQGKFVTGIKNFTYGATLGNPITALTQLQDVGVTISRHGLRNTLQGFGKMFTKGSYKLGDIGIDNFMADFERNTKMGNTMKIAMAPLTAMDIFGKKLNMNANLIKTQRALRNGNNPEINAEIERLFGEKAGQIKKDLMAGKKTFDTNLFMFNDLSKYHPISKAEVPTGYLNSNKLRLLYMLHTYQIKQLDIFRNDVYNQIKSGNVKKGAYNMANLTFWLLSTGMGVNAARDYVISGDTKELKDYFINGAGQMFLVNRYLLDKGFKEGVGTFLWDGVKPATVSIANDVSKDLKDIYNDKTEKGLRSTKYAPLAGRIYYETVGRGEKTRKKRK